MKIKYRLSASLGKIVKYITDYPIVTEYVDATSKRSKWP